jgi:hypothetical protein
MKDLNQGYLFIAKTGYLERKIYLNKEKTQNSANFKPADFSCTEVKNIGIV